MHEKYIRRCLELAEESLERGDNPFGCVIVCDNKIIVESGNNIAKNDVTNHAEIVAMRKAQEILGTSDLSNCIIYSNCEPCPMCAFMMRELKFNTVVFSLLSPHLGGYSKWNVLQDSGLARFEPVFSSPPHIVHGVLKKEAEEIFRRAGWTMDLSS
jgi:tRNA(adenine34) deaminase